VIVLLPRLIDGTPNPDYVVVSSALDRAMAYRICNNRQYNSDTNTFKTVDTDATSQESQHSTTKLRFSMMNDVIWTGQVPLMIQSWVRRFFEMDSSFSSPVEKLGMVCVSGLVEHFLMMLFQ